MQPDLFGGVIAMTTRPGASLHYYRCTGCLNAFTTREPLPPHPAHYGDGLALCACENDRHEYLGQTATQRFQKTVALCPCDARCTNAQGPQCDCQCRGANHGSQRLVIVVRDAGPVPDLNVKNPQELRRTRLEYEKAKAGALARIETKHGPASMADYRARRPLHYRILSAIAFDMEKWRKASGHRTHGGRLKALAAIHPSQS